jgi:hypothetical protein
MFEFCSFRILRGNKRRSGGGALETKLNLKIPIFVSFGIIGNNYFVGFLFSDPLPLSIGDIPSPGYIPLIQNYHVFSLKHVFVNFVDEFLVNFIVFSKHP